MLLIPESGAMSVTWTFRVKEMYGELKLGFGRRRFDKPFFFMALRVNNDIII